MPTQFSRVIASHAQGNGRTFSVKAIPLTLLSGAECKVEEMDG